MNCLVFRQSNLPTLGAKIKEYEEAYCHRPKEQVELNFSTFTDGDESYLLVCLGKVAPFHFANLCWFLGAEFGLYENLAQRRFIFSPSTEKDVLLGQRSDGLPLELFVPTTGICQTKRNAASVPSYDAGNQLVSNLRKLSPQDESTMTIFIEQPLCNDCFGNSSFSVNCEPDENWRPVVLAEEEKTVWDYKKVLQIVAAVVCGLAVSEMIYLLFIH